MKISRETHRDSKWVYCEEYDYDEQTGTHAFVTRSLRMTDERYEQVFGILENPIQHIKRYYGWDITPKRWAALTNIYEDDIHRLMWDLHEMVSPNDSVDVNLAVDIILSGKKLKPAIVKEYLIRLCRGDFTKQDGKDILTRLEAGENGSDVYTDKKYVKTQGIEDLVKKVYDTNREKFADVNSRSKMASWLVGQVMKETQGKCNPQEVKAIIDSLID